MKDMMDEARLLAMIEEKDPQDLSPEECAALLAAAGSSPAIARACRERIMLEQRLAEVLGHPGLSVDAILARARGRAGGPSGPGSRVALFLGLAISALLAIIAVSSLLRPRNRREVAVAEPASRPPAGAVTEQAVPPSEPVGDDDIPVVELAPSRKRPPASRPDATEPAAAEPTAQASSTPADPPPVADANPPPVAPSAAASSPAAPAPEPPPTPPEPVWQESLRAFGAIRPTLLRFRPPAGEPPSMELVKRWFEAVPGQPGQFGVHQKSGRAAGGFKGLVRLAAPLEEGACLRMAIHDWNGIRIHAWAGDRGATFAACGPAGPWAGYATSRSGQAPIPTGYVLLATDAGRMQRTQPAAPARLELRHADGLLTLSRGDVRILDVPLPSAPAQVFIEGFAEFAELAMVPAAPLAQPPLRLPNRSATLLGAATVRDVVLPDGSAAAELPDGRLALEARDNKQPARVMLRLPPGPPRAIVLQIDSFEPGTGVALGDAAGNPQRVLGFLANKHHKGLGQAEMLGPDGGQLDGDGRLGERPIAFVSGRTWVRLVPCGGVLRVATSPDGIHWAEFVHQGSVGSVGLSAAAHPSPRRIVLGGAWTEPFPLVASLAPLELPPPASPLPGNVPLLQWQQAAAQLRPGGVDERRWLLACAVRQLGGEASRDLAAALLDMLWQEGRSRPWPAETRLQFLAEVATLAPAWDDPTLAGWVAGRYEEVGLRLADEGERRPWSLVGPALMASPLASVHAVPCFPAWLARRELLGLLVARDGDFAEAAARGTFFNLPGTPPLFAWAVATAEGGAMHWEPARRTGKGNKGDKGNKGLAVRRQGRKGKRPPDLRHPVALEPTKEGITIAADIEAALSENAFTDVCRALFGGLSLPQGELAPDVADPDLVLTMPAFAAALLREHPGMRAAMAAEFEDRGGLRLRQAIDSGDALVLETVATQYPGTAAAAEASLLLGDRELAAGRFAVARQRYAAARGAVPARLASRLAASDGVAAGLLGEKAEVAGDGQVTVGGATLDVAGWRQLAVELGRERAAAAPLGRSAVAGTAVAALPAARDYAGVARARMEGDVGHGPGDVPAEYRRPTPSSPLHDVDWVARQVACAAAGPRLLVGNRFQLAAHDGQSGQLQWRTGLGNEVGHAHGFSGQPMRPVASTTHAFVRRLRPAGPGLAAIRLADGGVDWDVQPRPNDWFVASDPLLVDDLLQACTARKATEGWMLSLSSFDPVTGRIVAERPLTLMRDEWAAQGHDCQVAWAADGLVITCGGGTISCDTAGQIRWVRQGPWVPPAVDPLFRLQAQAPALVVDGRLCSVQPADPGVAIVDAITGRAEWKRGFAGIRRVLGFVGSGAERVLVAERDGGLVGLSAAEGEIVWLYETPDLLDGVLVAAEGVLLAEHEKVPAAETRRPVLVWLDPAGAVRRRCPLVGLEDPQPRLGPLVPAGGRLWALFGRGPGDATRDLVELTPK